MERNAAKGARASVERAARREARALQGISHPGIVQCDSMESHELGQALVFRYDERAMRLDHFMTQYGQRLDVDARIGMIRNLAETMQYAHGRRLYHRSLSARSILVTPGDQPGDRGWLRPRLAVSDWQAATRGETTSGGTLGLPSTTHPDAHVEGSAHGYLAPEFDNPGADPVAVDVFGLGAVAYLLLSGEPPAATRTELLSRLASDNGLRPSGNDDSVTGYMDELVQAATAPQVDQRTATVAEFLEMLELVEDDLTEPSKHPEPEVPDLLEAGPDDTVADWVIKRRLGTGSTSRAFLAERDGRREVLKVALSEAKVPRLEHEAKILRTLIDSRIIRLARQEPIKIGERWAIVLEHAGTLTLARKLRDDGRLTVDELETYSEYLFGAVDYLEGEGVFHRDIKPDNIAIRIRPNRTRQLVLFDFSLAGIPVKDLRAGTPRYLDPFIGTATRSVYDRHAEWYALAVTLHEMASGELPRWGCDDGTEAQFTEGPPVLAAEAFDPAIREGLAEFFLRALDRDARRRFESLKEMRDAWLRVFRRSDSAAPVGSVHPVDDNDEASDEHRDEAALRATRATPLEASGLTPRAVSAAHRLDVATVGQLLDKAPTLLFRMPGLGAKTRKELQQRVKQWRRRLHAPTPSPVAKSERRAARDTVTRADSASQLRAVGLDAIAALLVPGATRRNATEVQGIRLFLRLPTEDGTLPDLPGWPTQPEVAKPVGVTPGRIAQILIKQRKRWYGEHVVREVRTELMEMLAESGRVMGATELAVSLLTRRGSAQDRDRARLAIAMAAVRAAVEIDGLHPEPRLLTRRHGDRLTVALEVGGDEGPDTPAAPALLDYADALGQVADRLAGQEVLPSAATVLRELATVPPTGISLDERRMVRLAAVASRNAAASPRLEIYPRDLDPVRALRLAQAGVVVPTAIGGTDASLAPVDVKAKVRARFPELAELPDHPALHRLLGEAGFVLRYRDGRYHAPRAAASTSSRSLRRRSTRTEASPWTADTPEVAAAARAEQRLTVDGGGFRALTVQRNRCLAARDELVARFGARPFSVAEVFVAKLRELVDARPKPTWETVLRADAAEPGSRAAIKLSEYVEGAWRLAEPDLDAALDGSPLLLLDAAVFPRYRAMDLLYRLADRARGGGGWLWLLCPAADPGELPSLDGSAVQVTGNEWIVLSDAWVANQHRGGRAS